MRSDEINTVSSNISFLVIACDRDLIRLTALPSLEPDLPSSPFSCSHADVQVASRPTRLGPLPIDPTLPPCAGLGLAVFFHVISRCSRCVDLGSAMASPLLTPPRPTFEGCSPLPPSGDSVPRSGWDERSG